MSVSSRRVVDKNVLLASIQQLLPKLGEGRVASVAYDTAWIGRLSRCYKNNEFGDALDWLRQSQHADGTWGAPTVHYHDRFISTLAVIVTLREVGRDPRDRRRVQRGADALWRLVGRLRTDDSDTVGFPILSTSLTAEAKALGLEVPLSPIRHAGPYQQKVEAMLRHSKPKWQEHPVSFSLEGLRSVLAGGGDFLVGNGSVGTSPSATAALLLDHINNDALTYLQNLAHFQGDGGFPAVYPIDTFEIAWSLHHLRRAGAIQPDDPYVRQALDVLWNAWKVRLSTGFSTYFSTNLDDTSASFASLLWGGIRCEC